jgi:hypothetical protein
MIGKLISGGQTGVDRAALDVALEVGILCGGWCPRGRKAEDGTIPARYPLSETPSDDYSQRTPWNVRDSDGTLILSWGEPADGTLLTAQVCQEMDKPHLVIDLRDETNLAAAIQRARAWITTNLSGGVLNIAGPRASQHPDVGERARAFVQAVLEGAQR